MKNFNKKILASLLAAALVAVSLLGCGSSEAAEEGASITIIVTDNTGAETTYTGNTTAEFLLGAMEDLGITYDGYESDWGYYMTTVNGLTADYDADGAYWSIYVNGGYGEYGVDSQPVTDGDTYSICYEVYVAESAS